MKNNFKLATILIGLSPLSVAAQNVAEYNIDEIQVTGTRARMDMKSSVRMVQVLDRKQIEASSAQSVNDLLKLVAGVDVRQRGACGVQTDIGVNGGSSDQMTLLLNGVNISNPQTGHLTVDLPVSVDDIERIEVLEGGASRVYGSSAFCGAINIVTKQEKQSNVGVNLSGGSFGTMAGGAHVNYVSGGTTNRLSGGYSRSDGGTDNSDFKKGQLFWNGGYQGRDFDVRWQAGFSNMHYGANTFYSAAYNNQYEENKRLMMSVSAETKGKLHFMPSVYWNRSYDDYVLIRTNPSVYENFHQVNVYGADLSAYTDWRLGKTAFGVEVRNEGVLSSSLGKPLDEKMYVRISGNDGFYTNGDNRTNISYYLEHNVILDRITISAGLLANMNTALDYRYRLYPGVDVAWRPVSGLKLYASFNQALRMPTFTDLYYKSPTINGNIGLKPEKNSDFTIGASYSVPAFQMQAKAFYRHGTDMIDWVKYNAEDSYHSANFNLNNMGFEVASAVNFGEIWGESSFLKRFSAAYCYIHQERKDDAGVYRSNYAMDYLKHKLTASLAHRIVGNIEAQWDFRLKNRNGSFEKYEGGKTTGVLTPFGTYAVLDLKVQWQHKDCSVYVQASNLTNHKYYDLANVEQPGLWLMGGVKWNFQL